jgi:CPA2 family monovalent cation:H+ antiporter-2
MRYFPEVQLKGQTGREPARHFLKKNLFSDCPQSECGILGHMDFLTHDLSPVLIELGLVVIGLAILARIASRWGFSAIPLYLLAGLAFGKGGLAPLNVSSAFIHVGSEIGVLLLLFMLGLEYTGAELKANLRNGISGGFLDIALNFPPGFIMGLLLGWKP